MPSRRGKRLLIACVVTALTACASGGRGPGTGGTPSGGASAGAFLVPTDFGSALPVEVTTRQEPHNPFARSVVGSGAGSMIGAAAPATKGENYACNPTQYCFLRSGTPLLQSAMRVTSSGIEADVATNYGGATLTAVDASAGKYQLTIPSLSIDYLFNAPSSMSPSIAYGTYLLTPPSGDVVRLVTDDLYYVQFGSWAVSSGSTGAVKSFGYFATGIATTQMPTTGTATYEPSVGAVTIGVVLVPSTEGFTSAVVSGLGTLEANFGTGVVGGTFKNMNAWDGTAATPWNDVSVTATIAGGTPTFSGTTAATSAPVAPFALKGTATGHIDGAFYGPNADEVGAIWSLSDGVGSAIGVFGGSTIP